MLLVHSKNHVSQIIWNGSVENTFLTSVKGFAMMCKIIGGHMAASAFQWHIDSKCQLSINEGRDGFEIEENITFGLSTISISSLGGPHLSSSIWCPPFIWCTYYSSNWLRAIFHCSLFPLKWWADANSKRAETPKRERRWRFCEMVSDWAEAVHDCATRSHLEFSYL